MSKLSDLEILSRSMEQDIASYKIMFEKNNNTMVTMSENVEDQIVSLNISFDMNHILNLGLITKNVDAFIFISHFRLFEKHHL